MGDLSPVGHKIKHKPTVPRPAMCTYQYEVMSGALPHQGPLMFSLCVFSPPGFHCPVCSKFMASDEIEKHLLMCFSKTRLTYNSKTEGEILNVFKTVILLPTANY